MPSTRTNLTGYGPNSSYVFLTILFTILSVVGILLFFQVINLSPDNQAASTTTPVQEGPPILETDTPTPLPQEEESPSPTVSAAVTKTNSPSPTLVLESPTPTPLIQNFSSEDDKFSVSYSSDRKVYQDKEATGNRYTFYRNSGNIAVHTGTSWSWIHPAREFKEDLKIDGHPTFRYEIATQTIVDVEANDLKYTIQCLHGGTDGLKAECNDFLQAFKLSP